MNDPWEDVRVTAILETIEKDIGYEGSGIVVIGSLKYLNLKSGARIIEDDLDKLLAVVRQVEVVFDPEPVSWDEGDERETVLLELLAALPEHLK